MPKILEIEAASQDVGARADVLLSRKSGLSRNAVTRLIERGAVTFSGMPIKKNRRVEPGDVYTLVLPEPEPDAAQPRDIPLEIVYEDDDLLVINKPRGMVVHPAPGHRDDTLVNALLNHCGDSLSGVGGVLRPGIVHRLDKDTSGLMLAAKNDKAHVSLSAQLKNRQLKRVYEAVVVGNLREDSGRVEAPVGRHPTDRKKMAANAKIARPAVTHYEVIARYPGYTHVRCMLETGRTHQIRVHMAHIGHPVAGDLTYGGKNNLPKLGGQCLHARSIGFIHPRTGESMSFSSELPAYFNEFLGTIGG